MGEDGSTIRYSLIREILNKGSNDEISDSSLSRKLLELTNLGIVNRMSYDKVPPRVEYGLTGAGMTIFHTLQQIAEWTREQCHNGALQIPRKKAMKLLSESQSKLDFLYLRSE